ncbi:hypothetical protein JCM10449v2_000297 [Rhodotorula kratochvilovae]
MLLRRRSRQGALLCLLALVFALLSSTAHAARSPPGAAFCPLPALALLSTLPPAYALPSLGSSSTGIFFCRCTCFGKKENATIIPLYRPQNPANPCLSCTRQFCLDQKLPACVGAQTPEEDPDTATGEGGDVEAKCFQRDSPKSHFIVILFLVLASTLLVLAALKHYGIDLQAIFARAGVRGMLVEVVQAAQARVRGRRGGPSYSSVS